MANFNPTKVPVSKPSIWNGILSHQEGPKPYYFSVALTGNQIFRKDSKFNWVKVVSLNLVTSIPINNGEGHVPRGYAM